MSTVSLSSINAPTSSGEKIKKIDTGLEKDELRIYVDAKKDILYEQERFDKRSGFFEEVYGVHPKLYRMKNR